MAFDQATRNRLSKFVSDTRKLLSDEFAQQMRVKYGLDPATGVVTDIDKLPTLAEGDRQTAQMLRDTLEHYLATAPKRDKKSIASTIDRIVREQAFTVLNRLCAVRMAESRELVIESIAQGTKSKGFQLYARLAGSALGETGEAYVCYLFSLFDELSIDLPVLFDRFSPSGRLFPRESVLLDVLGQINHHELQHLWAEDETIGWIYQYFNSDEERKAMRDVKAGGSAAPRNSRELAVRNQFFTPRYVVEFLTDNTLGRIWYEMTQGQTLLVDNCKYLVRRPDEVFLSQMTSKDQGHPSDGTIAMAELLLSGTEETFPEFKADDPQPMIELAHCVSAYATLGDRAHEILGNRTLIVRERSIHEPTEIADAVEAAPYVFAGQLETLKTQHILEVLFMTCRSDRHGGDGSVYSESWFVDGCNEVRRRVIDSRRDDLSQEELLRQPVFIPYRPMKDPRDIKMLDPACGSMHFGLYAFDLFLSIYEEAWELEERLGDEAFVRPRELKSLQDSYGTRERYKLDIPRLIIERNIHGIDIDARAVQIAGLSLWLRAQKAWHEAEIKPAARSQITRSNIVCAEPMPGESELLEQFITDHLSQTSEQQTIASIVRCVFDAMKLAGEAGSLLKIEAEIAETIAEAKKKWVEGPKALQLPLFSIDAQQKDSDARPLLVAGIDDASFWDEIEERIYNALQNYGEQAGGGFKLRLFTNDAAQGFAFIDLCRKRYEVVLMNPPFGDCTLSSQQYLNSRAQSLSSNILCLFTSRALTLVPSGYIGAITDNVWVKKTDFEGFRTTLLGKDGALNCLVDLGWGVLDGANVATCAFTVDASTKDKRRLLAIRLIDHARDSLDEILAERTSEICDRKLFKMTDIFLRQYSFFEKFPTKSIAYETPAPIVFAFSNWEPLEPTYAITRRGYSPGNTLRYFRCWWEVPAGSRGTRWWTLNNGGQFSPLIGDGYFCAYFEKDWKSHRPIKGFRLESAHWFGKPGLCWGKRTNSMYAYPLPAGSMFSNEGHSAFPKSDDYFWPLLAYLNSSLCQAIVNLYCGQHKEAGYIEKLPTPALESGKLSNAGQVAADVISASSQLLSYVETHELFYRAVAFDRTHEEVEREFQKFGDFYESSITELDRLVLQLAPNAIDMEETILKLADRPRNRVSHSLTSLRWDCAAISYAIGVSFGRWDIRHALNSAPEMRVNPCTAFPRCPPGQLTNNLGLPPERNDFINSAYPCEIAWDGVIADGVGAKNDGLTALVCDVMSAIWPEKADDILANICSSLAVSDLSDFINDADGFFASHLSTYSKGRRQAPIYWPLSTKSGRYTLWIYFHRITDQTLYTAVNNFVEPSLKDTLELVKSLKEKNNRSRDEEVDFERWSQLAEELEDFRSELLRIGKSWKPNLNDGVQITAAPLWQFFQNRKWRETLKKTWDDLEEGKLDWAHVALSIWPERVVRSAHKDRSTAIAHNLEDPLWHEVEVKKTSKTGRVSTKIEWQPRDLSEMELDAIVVKVKRGELGTDHAAPAEVANG